MTKEDPITADWIAVDWGTTNMRAWAMSKAGKVLAHAGSDKGMGTLAPDEFEAALLDVVSDWLPERPVNVIACGMVGSRQGWVEAPYRATPCAAPISELVAAPTDDPLLQVHVIPGVKQTDPADVMRGEETQIAGFLSLNKDWDGVICLPGTHSKWVQVSAGEIVSFKTFMTGELFSVISKETVLRHSIPTEGWDEDAFLHALDDTLSRPDQIAARMFSLRAESLLNDLDGAAARARLSGLLIGAELSAAKPYWLGQQIALIGAAEISRLYATALSTQGTPLTRTDAPRMTLAGLTAAHAAL